MTFKRKALSALSRPELLEVGRALELDVTTSMRLDDLMDVVAGSKKRGMLEKILPLLSRDTLKAICEAVGISQDGREKQGLIDRILEAGGEGPANVGAEAEGKTGGVMTGKSAPSQATGAAEAADAPPPTVRVTTLGAAAF